MVKKTIKATLLDLICLNVSVPVCVYDLSRRKGKVRRKSRYKMLGGEDQDSMELHPPRPGKATTINVTENKFAII